MDLKKLLPHTLAITFFLAITLVYFFPVLQGKEISQHDIAQWEGMSKEIQDFRAEHDSEPLWTRSMFSGMPAYQISALYNSNLLRYVNKIISFGLPSPLNYIFLALLGFYLLMIYLKVDFKIAIAGAIGFAFTSYNVIIIMAGHNSKMHAIALIPFVVLGMLMVLRGRYLIGGALTSLFLGLEIYANHLQITYYLALALFILMIIEFVIAVREKEILVFIKKSLVIIAATTIAILPNITSLWATYEYGKYSTRGPSELTEKMESSGLDKDYALGWSYGVKESLTMLIPNFMGGPTQSELDQNSTTYKAMVSNGAGAQANQFIKQVPLYWGDQPFTSGPNYNGAVIFFMFVLAIFIFKGKWKWWIIITSVLFLMLSWGKNFLPLTDLFFYYFPGYNKFRAVSMILCFLGFTLPFLGVIGLSKIKEINKKTFQKALFTSFYILGGLTLLFSVIPGLSGGFYGIVDEKLSGYPDWLLEAIQTDRAEKLRIDAIRSFIFVGLTFGLLYFHFIKSKINSTVFAILLITLMIFDLWGVDKRYLGFDKFSKASKSETFVPSDIDLMILQDDELGYRVMNASVSTFNDASTSYFHHSIGGYHGAKLKRYQELIEYQINKNNMSVLDMLNTKYIILPKQDGTGSEVQVNPGALGAAWFVDSYKIVENADEEMEALSSISPGSEAIVDKRFSNHVQGVTSEKDSTAFIKLISYQPNYLVYQSSSFKSQQLAVFSEIFYDKGWHAFIDGKAVDHFRVNYVLRGLVIPEGKHDIEFKFEPLVYNTGELIAMWGSVLMFGFLGFAFFKEFQKSKKLNEVDSSK